MVWWEMSSVTRSRFGEGVKRPGFGRFGGVFVRCVFCMRQRWIAGGKLPSLRYHSRQVEVRYGSPQRDKQAMALESSRFSLTMIFPW